MEEKFCQSCAMPMGQTDELHGTEANGEKSADYCDYCYQDGQFTAKCTMEEMIEFCVPHMAQPDCGMTEDKARETMREFFPMLKRWKQA